MKKLTGIILILFFLVFNAEAKRNNLIQDIKKLQDVFVKIGKYHVNNPKYDDLIKNAIEGMISGLDDTYTVYMPKEQKDSFEDMLKAHFGGLGIQISIYEDDSHDTWVKIVGILPVKVCPAREAGLKGGDIIKEIDGNSAKGIGLKGASEQLRGPIGSEVMLTILRDSETLKFPVKRADIKLPVTAMKMLEDNIGYIRLSSFTELSASEVKEKLNTLEDSGITSLIFDLRNNHGGYLTAAVDIVNLFLNKGKRIVYTKDKNDTITSEYYSTAEDYFDRPVILLVNGQSASASEIVSGALKDWNRAVLVGTKTFGKGSVQKIFQLNDESGLKLTIAKYYTPSGICIHKKGIEPHIKVEYKYVNGKDSQLEEAIKVLKSYNILSVGNRK